MFPTVSNQNQKLRPSIWYTAVALLWLFLLYGRSLYQATPERLQSAWQLLGPLNLTFDFLNPIFWSPLTFAVGYSLGMGIIILGIVKIRHGRWRWIFVAFGLTGVLFPFVMPVTYGVYQLPVQAADGYELRWVTEPGNRFSSAFKQAQLSHEGGCDYHLSGWASNSTLTYTSDCWPGVWQYNLDNSETDWDLQGKKAIGTEDVRRWNGKEYLSQPINLQEAGKYPFLTLDRAVSPDGRWEAIVVRWFYGPSDIVVTSRAK